MVDFKAALEREKLKEKVRKLWRLAKSQNQHEATLATKKAREINAKYKLNIPDEGVDDMVSRADRGPRKETKKGSSYVKDANVIAIVPRISLTKD